MSMDGQVSTGGTAVNDGAGVNGWAGPCQRVGTGVNRYASSGQEVGKCQRVWQVSTGRKAVNG